MEIFIVKIIVIIILCILMIVMMADYMIFAILEIKRKRKIYCVSEELLDLNLKHDSAFCYYKLIPADYDEIVNKMKKKKIYVTKEEINSIYKKLIEE